MKIVQINVRLTEGGAARVALDLHRRLQANGDDSRFHYGYGRRVRDNPEAQHIAGVTRLAGWATVLPNYFVHELLGSVPIPPLGTRAALLARHVAEADAVHLHVAHSYFLPLGWLANLLRSSARRVIWTNHDQWLLTGRCAITEGCEAWRTGCGACPTSTNYPRARLDLSATRRKRRLATVRSLAERLTLVSPSRFLRDRLRQVYPDLDVTNIPNGTDLDFEQHLDTAPAGVPESLQEMRRRPRVLIVANDLSHRAKADPDIIEALRDRADFDLVTVGARSAFTGENVINLGTIADRRQLIAVYRACDVLLFTSTVDNSPLVIIEALSAGLPVLAVPSDAAGEILARIDARPVADVAEMGAEMTRLQMLACYGGRSRDQIAQAARNEYAGARVMRAYRDLYSRPLETIRPRNES